MLRSITIGHIKSFHEPQTLTFSEANGTKGSGYNVIVGANNSGKSTVISLAAQLLAPDEHLTIGRESRHVEKPLIEVALGVFQRRSSCGDHRSQRRWRSLQKDGQLSRLTQ
ncbi:AAA family ATPase [Bradyrhizobium sp. USDA 372]